MLKAMSGLIQLAGAMSTVADCRIIELPKIADARGNLTFVEGGRHIPFFIRRVYWIYDVPGGAIRGGHAYKELEEFAIALSGSFEFHLDDGTTNRVVTLNRPYLGLYLPRMIWRHIENFSTNAVCLLLASAAYCEQDYVRNYQHYRELRGAGLDHR